MNVFDEIEAGRYVNKVPYRIEPEPITDDMTVRQARELKDTLPQRQAAQRRLHHEEDARLVALFKSDLEEEHGVKGNPKADRLFEIAWSSGKSSGYHEVAIHYEEMVELIK